MELNLPILDQLMACQNLLIAGMGGGYDVFSGLPIYLTLRQRGQNVHLASFSFSDIAHVQGGIRLTPTLVGAVADQADWMPYFPELHLAQWFKETRQESVTVWCFHKTGARPLLKNYQALVEHLKIDGVLLVDGGVDSLMRGDEAEKGTWIEDLTSLFAVNELIQLPVRLLACIGLGAEQDMTYANVLENIAALTKAGGFLGVCSLTPQMDVYQRYESAVLYTQGKPHQDSSVISSSIISAVRGQFGNYHLTERTRGSRLWISPLMPIYWFFDLPSVARQNLFLSQLRDTETFREAVQISLRWSQSIKRRPDVKIPL